MFDFSGRVVLVTGGSRGIGAEICRKFVTADANVIVNHIYCSLVKTNHRGAFLS